MKRIAWFVALGFLAGFLCGYVLLTPRVLAQSPAQNEPGRLPGATPLANQRFVVMDESHHSVGALLFDASGMPVISLTGQLANRLGGHVVRVFCEIRPWYAYEAPAQASH
jgi:hypothetical protein